MTDHGPARSGAVAFGEVQRVLGLFADGVAGEAMRLEVVDDATAGWPWDTATTPSVVIRLPEAIDDFATGPENRGAYRAAVLHQVGFAQFGTLAFTSDGLDAHDRVDAHHHEHEGTVDAIGEALLGVGIEDRRSDLERFFDRAARPELLRRVFAMLENLRIDAATRRGYPGACVDLDRVLALARARARTPPEQAADPHASPVDALVETLRLRSLGAAAAELVDEQTGPGRRWRVEQVLELAGAVEHPAATVYASARAARAICAVIVGDVAPGEGSVRVIVEAGVADEGSGGSPQTVDDVAGDRNEDAPPPTVGKDDRGADGSDLGGQPADVLAHEPQTTEDDEEAGVIGGRVVEAPLPPLADADGARIYLYDEWDHLGRTHLREWCRIVERRLHGDDFAFIGDVRRRYAVLGSRLRRQFAFLRPEGWVRVHRCDDGDELDLDAVIQAVVDRRTGHAADDRLHIRRDRAVRDVATAFLVDLSASTGSALPDPDEMPTASGAESQEIEYRFAGLDPWDLAPPTEPRRRVLDIAKESVALMCDALHLLGDRHAVYGFSGEGRGKVEFHVAKDFDDRTSPSSWAALAAMQPRRYTRMGPAIRHATAKIASQPERTKLLIVISDGYPQDVDYGPDRADKEYGLQDTARALEDAAAAGIATFCVTIDPAGHDYLRRMCADQSYLVIDDVPSLPGELAKLYGTLAVRSS